MKSIPKKLNGAAENCATKKVIQGLNSEVRDNTSLAVVEEFSTPPAPVEADNSPKFTPRNITRAEFGGSYHARTAWRTPSRPCRTDSGAEVSIPEKNRRIIARGPSSSAIQSWRHDDPRSRIFESETLKARRSERPRIV